MTATADRLDTAAQLIHAARHRAGTGQVCDPCRELAAEIADVLDVERLATIERRARARSESYVLDRDGQIARWILNGDKG